MSDRLPVASDQWLADVRRSLLAAARKFHWQLATGNWSLL